jgi:hypothetical protein
VIGARIKRTRKGDYQLRLPIEERDLLRSLPGQLRDLLGTDDPSLHRLFPPAYSDDAEHEHEDEYRRLMGDDLEEHHRQALSVMEETIDADRLDEDQLTGWLAALNQLRLVLGTRLDVSEDMYEHEMDPADPQAPAFALYSYLGWLQEQAVAALADW